VKKIIKHNLRLKMELERLAYFQQIAIELTYGGSEILYLLAKYLSNAHAWIKKKSKLS